ncbi:hypothetical protein SORDD17_01872 [Streptococcus oralis]|uniref:Uncharacterized protein n=1 Tax=Streptococcus oralis TaxID=1303 RepID=A0A139RAM6_STROR|nr:hypothetical protein SORDD17_01872 [Streptococcus oralis]
MVSSLSGFYAQSKKVSQTFSFSVHEAHTGQETVDKETNLSLI